MERALSGSRGELFLDGVARGEPTGVALRGSNEMSRRIHHLCPLTQPRSVRVSLPNPTASSKDVQSPSSGEA